VDAGNGGGDRCAARPVDHPGGRAGHAWQDQIANQLAAFPSYLNNIQVFAKCLSVELGEAPLSISNRIMHKKCVVCFSRGNLRRYVGHFPWLKASICRTCEAEGAEPLGLILLWISVRGGPEACSNAGEGWVTYSPPNYVGWDAIRLLYIQEIDGVLSLIGNELGQEYANAIKSGLPSRLQ
jgi:hypothetical protein